MIELMALAVIGIMAHKHHTAMKNLGQTARNYGKQTA